MSRGGFAIALRRGARNGGRAGGVGRDPAEGAARGDDGRAARVAVGIVGAVLAAFAAAPAGAQNTCTTCFYVPVVASSPASGDTYKPGETIVVQVRPRQVPWVSLGSADNPRLALNVGGTTKTLSGTLQRRQYSYTFYDTDIRQNVTRSRNTNVLEFRYTVRKGDRDTNGVSVAAKR